MKLRWLLFLILTGLFFCGKPQISWQTRIDTGTDESTVKLLNTADQLILVANQGKKEQGRVVWLVQYLDHQGRLLKRSTYAEASLNIARDACRDESAHLYLCGYTRLHDTTICLIVKINPAGKTVWKKGLAFGAATWANGISVVDNGIAITGGMETPEGNDLFVARIDAEGKTVWSRNYHLAEPAEGWKIKADSRGNLVVLGRYCSGPDILLMQIKPNGDTAWTRRYDSGGSDEPGNLIIDRFDNIIAVNTAHLADSTRCVILEYTADGGAVRKVAYGENAQAEGADLNINDDGTIVIAGTLFNPKGKQPLVFEYLPNATAIWERQLNLGSAAEGKSLLFQDGIVVAADVAGQNTDIIVLKLNWQKNSPAVSK